MQALNYLQQRGKDPTWFNVIYEINGVMRDESDMRVVNRRATVKMIWIKNGLMLCTVVFASHYDGIKGMSKTKICHK